MEVGVFPVLPEPEWLYPAGGLQDGPGRLYRNRMDDTVEFDLAEYGIDLIPEDGAYCLPFQTMNGNFLGKEYLHSVFTGDSVPVFAYGMPGIGEIRVCFQVGISKRIMQEQYGRKPDSISMTYKKGLSQNTDFREIHNAAAPSTAPYGGLKAAATAFSQIRMCF